jgi:hypothetical protein
MDETSRRQVLIVNVVISIITSDNELRTICMSSSIILKDGTADEQSQAIIGVFNDSGCLLDEWRNITAEMYPGDNKLLACIPISIDMSPTKLIGGFLYHNNCATANKTGNNVMDMILKLCEEAGMNDQDLILYQGHCFNHLWSTWFEAIENIYQGRLQSSSDMILSQSRHTYASHARLVIFYVKLIRNTHSQQITSREAVMLIQIGRSAFALARDTFHPFEY